MNKWSVMNLPIRVEEIAFLYWLSMGMKSFMIFILFRSNPAMGTIANGMVSLFFAFILFTITPLFRFRAKPVKLTAAFLLPFFFILWSALTITWTHAASKPTSIAYLLLTLLDFYVIYSLFKSGEAASITLKSIQGIVFGALLLGGVILVTGSTTGGRLGDDDFLHPNSIGNQMGIACLCSIWITLNSRSRGGKPLFWGLVSVILFLALLQSLSKTAILAFFVAATLFISKTRNKLSSKSFYISLFLSVVLLMSAQLETYMSRYLTKTQGGDALSTVSGRSFIWEETWGMIKEHPMYGFGYMSYKDHGPQTAEVQLVHAHNEWIHLWFTLGLVGVVLAASTYIAFYLTMRRAGSASSIALLGSSLLLYFLVRGITEASVSGLVFPISLLVLFLASSGVERGQAHIC